MMLWLNPAGWFAIAALAAPILIHLLIQRRAERLPFPTLRFLQPTRLASIRRHVIEDWPLLAIRAAILAAAAAALAGPLLITAARTKAWDNRIARAMVAPDGAQNNPAAGPVYRQQTFAGASIQDGIRRAALWLESAPPARREIVVASPFPIGSITQADIDAVPAEIGLRFERRGTLPASRTVSAGRLIAADGAVERQVTFDGDRTSAHESASGESIPWPIDVVAAPADRTAIDAAIAAVRSQRIWAPAGRRARLVLVSPTDSGEVSPKLVSEGGPKPIGEGRAAGAVAKIADDRDLTAAAARVPKGLSDPRYSAAPWQTLASAADGRPMAAAAASSDPPPPAGFGETSRLLVVSSAPATDVATPILIRALANAVAEVPDLQPAEVTPIADAVLQRWSRPAAPVSSPRPETVDTDDRRWLWIAVLALLALEMWVRRSRAIDGSRNVRSEDARVA